LAELEVLKHAAHSSDLGTSDYHLFPNLKKKNKGTKLSTTEYAMSAADDWFATQPSGIYLDGVKKLEQWSGKFHELRG
jgi:ABC-type branched-subunit amino acid transport system ATPase component